MRGGDSMAESCVPALILSYLILSYLPNAEISKSIDLPGPDFFAEAFQGCEVIKYDLFFALKHSRALLHHAIHPNNRLLYSPNTAIIFLSSGWI